MTDHDFTCTDHGTTATIVTNNWTTTQWVRDNVPAAEGQVTGANYATITGEPRFMMEIATGLIDAGFTCVDHELLKRAGSC